ncbi:hypothetical protein QQM79_14435 [Marinobacteraceae bacterium S3BR75-40.1]
MTITPPLKRGLQALVLVAALPVSTALLAHESHDERPPGPPPEAFKACEGLHAGAKVSFETPRGHTLKATCKKIRGKLVAVPKHHKPPKPPADEE